MAQACYKPVIEYCGGTEIGGGFVTGTLLQPQSLAAFSTPAMGCSLFILGNDGMPLVRFIYLFQLLFLEGFQYQLARYLCMFIQVDHYGRLHCSLYLLRCKE